MSKSFGTMISGEEALEMIDQIGDMIELEKQKIEFAELFYRMKNRFSYHIEQAKPIKPVHYRGKSIVYDFWKCGNCGCGITYDVTQNYCWNCGHKIAWENPRCMTGIKDPKK